ncbi:MAG: hypothetical protein JO093_20540 [Acidobacteria bacterium]|nr:hypothetical protein [Acidobacteriota bacterium]
MPERNPTTPNSSPIGSFLCADESCALFDHVTIAATGERWHIVPATDEMLAMDGLVGARAQLAKPDNRFWGQDILILRLIARIRKERATVDYANSTTRRALRWLSLSDEQLSPSDSSSQVDHTIGLLSEYQVHIESDQ